MNNADTLSVGAQVKTRALSDKKLSAKQSAPTLTDSWFAQNGWQPFPFQQQVWQAIGKGVSGLLHATTGAGKTYAVWFAALNRFAEPGLSAEATARKRKPLAAPLTVLWVTPMRALAAAVRVGW